MNPLLTRSNSHLRRLCDECLPTGGHLWSFLIGYCALVILVASCQGVAAVATTTAPVVGGTISGIITNAPASETVYLDANNNGKLDPGELSTTAVYGVYSFTGVPAGPTIVRQVLPAGYLQLTPVTPAGKPTYGIHVLLKPGQSLGGQNFVDGPASTFVTGLGAAAAAQSTYNVGQAPAIAWCDARALGAIRYPGGHPGLGDTFAWDFGGPGHYVYTSPLTQQPVDLSNGQHGPLAAFLYDAPGTYKITLTVTKPGQPAKTYATSAVVAPDQRQHYYFATTGSDANTGTDAAHPWAADKFQATAGLPNVSLLALDVVQPTITSSIRLLSNTVIDGPFAPNFVGGGFTGWAGQTSNVLIRGMTVNSPGVAAMTGMYPAIHSNIIFFDVRGTGIGVVNCNFNVINKAMYYADAGLEGVLLQGCRELQPDAMWSNAVMHFAGSRFINLANSFTSSATEITDRIETPGNGLVFEHNYFDQDITPLRTAAKGCFCSRQSNDLWVGNNVFADATVSVTSGGASDGTRYKTTNSRITGNFVTSPKAIAIVSIEQGAIGCTVDNNTIDRANGPALQLAPAADGSWPESDIVIAGNHLTGAGSRFDVQGASAATVSAIGAVRPLVATTQPAVPILTGLVTDIGFTSSKGSAVLPAATTAVEVWSK